MFDLSNHSGVDLLEIITDGARGIGDKPLYLAAQMEMVKRCDFYLTSKEIQKNVEG